MATTAKIAKDEGEAVADPLDGQERARTARPAPAVRSRSVRPELRFTPARKVIDAEAGHAAGIALHVQIIVADQPESIVPPAEREAGAARTRPRS